MEDEEVDVDVKPEWVLVPGESRVPRIMLTRVDEDDEVEKKKRKVEVVVLEDSGDDDTAPTSTNVKKKKRTKRRRRKAKAVEVDVIDLEDSDGEAGQRPKKKAPPAAVASSSNADVEGKPEPEQAMEVEVVVLSSEDEEESDVDVTSSRGGDQGLPHCCGLERSLKPVPLVCQGIEGGFCIIQAYKKYYADRENKFIFCESCLNPGKNMKGFIKVSSNDKNHPGKMAKRLFEPRQNDKRCPEPTIACQCCKKTFHNSCVLFYDLVNRLFTCDECNIFHKKDTGRSITAKDIPHVPLTEYIERKVSTFLETKGVREPVRIRAVECSKEEARPCKNFKRFYSIEDTVRYPYWNLMILAYQEIDGDDVAFFGLTVQEYGDDSPASNRRCIYIAFLDSVQFFKPNNLKTCVYQEILYAYMEHRRDIGFEKIFIWACPPKEGIEYLFYCHPETQRFPTEARLIQWYTNLLDEANKRGIVDKSRKDFLKYAIDDLKMTKMDELPYFEGDHWPRVIESVIGPDRTMLKMEVEEQETTIPTPRRGQHRGRRRGTTKKSKKNRVPDVIREYASKVQIDGETKKLLEEIHLQSDAFFVAWMDTNKQVSTIPQDLSPLLPGVINRESLLDLCQKHGFEFSDLRVAKYATLGIICHTLYGTRGKVCFKCRKATVVSGYHCLTCRVFFCKFCFKSDAEFHEHELTRTGDIVRLLQGVQVEVVDVDADDVVNDENNNTQRVSLRDNSLLKMVEALHHSAACKRSINCVVPNCQKGKSLLRQLRTDGRVTTDEIPRVMEILCSHARFCLLPQEACLLPFCKLVKDAYTKIESRLNDTHISLCTENFQP